MLLAQAVRTYLCKLNAGFEISVRPINPRPDGVGGGGAKGPWWFFVNNSNLVGNSALKFSVPLRASILHIL